MDNKELNSATSAALTRVPNTRLVQALKKNTIERIKHEIDMNKKLFKVELEYQNKFKQLDAKRRMIITGEYVPTNEECKYEYANYVLPLVETGEKGIPKFWPTIFDNLDMISDMIQQHDHDLIDHLIDIRCVLIEEPMGYRLEFEFSENEFFTNKVLTKEYYFADGFDIADPLNYDSLYVNRCKGCKIDWKSPSKDKTHVPVCKKMKNRKSNQVKTVKKIEKCDSFFNFFDPPEVKMEDADDDTKELLASDFDIAETFRLNIIPRAIIYYTGEGIEEDEYSEGDELIDEDLDDEEEDIEESDDEEDEEDEDEDEEPKRAENAKKPKAKGAKKPLRKHGKSQLNNSSNSVQSVGRNTPSECKQQ